MSSLPTTSIANRIERAKVSKENYYGVLIANGTKNGWKIVMAMWIITGGSSAAH